MKHSFSEKKPIKQGATIMVVDSDIDACHKLQALLADLNVEIQCFYTADSALHYINTNKPACMIVQIDLPDMGGIELLEHLQQKNIDIPTIILADSSDVRTAVRAMQANAADFMEKPVVARLILKRIKQILDDYKLNHH